MAISSQIDLYSMYGHVYQLIEKAKGAHGIVATIRSALPGAGLVPDEMLEKRGDGSRQPSKNELTFFQYQGKHVAKISSVLIRGRQQGRLPHQPPLLPVPATAA